MTSIEEMAIAGLAISGKRDVKEWYQDNKNIIILHPDTRVLVENYLWRY